MTGEERAASARADQAEVVGNDRASMHLLYDASDTAGALSSLEVHLGVGADGAAPHFHTRSSELFYVLDGELRVMAGDEIVTVAAGGSLVVPKLMPHAFGATPDSAARVLIVLTPGVQRFEYFRLLARIQAGEASVEELAPAQEEYDNHFVDAPQWWRDRNGSRARQ
ncbi:cupin domain-containing protein [Rhodococcus oryzae]|uniref:Cupin domain-containing protein n=1 Tax=Rhodococcus oryzae TaxID=2571143 RepID=A0ABY2RHL9_9NOCA|nr:cupin domain-containing protein [Rhodococcus oryzae]